MYVHTGPSSNTSPANCFLSFNNTLEDEDIERILLYQKPCPEWSKLLRYYNQILVIFDF